MSDFRSDRPHRTPGLTAKQEILARVRSALSTPRTDAITDAADVPRAYERADPAQESTDPVKVRDLLVKRLEDYTAVVHRTEAAGVSAAVRDALGDSRSVVIPPGLPATWTAELTGEVTVDRGDLGPRDLDGFDAVVTGCHVAIATTGTIVLRSDDLGGRRIISLIPDRHVVVLEAGQITVGVPRAIARMAEDPTTPWTMISGPSATSDIELVRVEGVHGPRQLHIVLVEPAAPEAAGESATTSRGEKTP